MPTDKVIVMDDPEEETAEMIVPDPEQFASPPSVVERPASMPAPSPLVEQPPIQPEPEIETVPSADRLPAEATELSPDLGAPSTQPAGSGDTSAVREPDAFDLHSGYDPMRPQTN